MYREVFKSARLSTVTWGLFIGIALLAQRPDAFAHAKKHQILPEAAARLPALHPLDFYRQPAPVRAFPAPAMRAPVYVAPINNGVSISPCCSSIRTSNHEKSEFEIRKDTDEFDPYTTGPTEVYRAHHPVHENLDYIYRAPTLLGSSHQIPRALSYEITPQYSSETLDQYHLRRLAEVLRRSNADVRNITTEVGSGSQSHVFMVHDPVPGNLHLSDGDSSFDSRLLWASSHSREVIKVRTPAPWQGTLQQAANQARRDIALTEVYESCVRGFKIIERGKQKELIQVVHYKNTQNELQHGIFRQPTVDGDTAYKIALQVSAAQQGNRGAARYLTENLGFRDVQEAELKIRVLEAFYMNTHFDVIEFESLNNIPMMAGKVRNTSYVRNMTVGFDYNLGQNVIWDAKARVFKAIDF
jgi:hypothetical protein